MFQQLKGVKSAVSGYSGGRLANPTYEQVCSGNTGHAEVIQVTYDPAEISFTDILRVFWQTHDPTTLNRQGHDVGTQYRSAIFYHNDAQRKLAEEYKKQLDGSGTFSAPIVTEITQVRKVLSGREVSPGILRAEPGPAVLRVRDPAEGREVPQGVCGLAERCEIAVRSSSRCRALPLR